ncbi:Tetratricopeptide repeat-containing protein [Erythrobacter litoralis]|jgi:tetratricopeptide (TPR) repeat protein|uniref:Uncharacterized protein n=1 Tax=Erythrobacter litoralis TaxID=39960 RepID=A0A074NFR3_9SPHN|nr:tetratricopeptide repeat protein [Erythrobacter litoralis]AOL24949.1 Tetratricopeptide repeat-containing protein [Erythrobacter litoralis]KEO96472.1 hypothetical protein EH32_09590 [Erythrobacter litoralis]MEE4337899.1 tetratricopeptide repeat protein [Erythrobacter sp.]
MSLFLALLLQVGPDPTAGAIAGEPDELVNRPPRAAETIEAPLDPVSQWLKSCLEQVVDDPARAHAKAQIRRNETFGEQRVIANHCLGVAATELGLWDDARAAFLAARDETPQGEARTRARFGAMAGNAALAAGDPASALTLLAAAEDDARTAASASLEAIAALDRGRALVALDRPEDALAALRDATRLAPTSGEAWLLEATLLRRLERLDEAQAAIERAVELVPMDGAVGLEAGVIAVLAGREEAARESWESVIATQPESLAAKTAKAYLAQLPPAVDNAPREEPQQ